MEMEIEMERCPSCSYPVNSPSGKQPILPQWVQNQAAADRPVEPNPGQARTSSPLRNTGRFNTVGSFNTPESRVSGSLRNTSSLKSRKEKNRIYYFLMRDLSFHSLVLSLFIVAALGALGAAGIYVRSLLNLKLEVTASDIEGNPQLKALKIVQNHSSSAQGPSISQRVEQFIKEHQLTSYHWWSAPEKNSGQYAVVFVFTKDRTERIAIWLVDLEKNRFKPDNPLAESFSGL
jgi:hypothetical protein